MSDFAASTPLAVYPRTRGATRRSRVLVRTGRGLSPHARGNPAGTGGLRRRSGSIPARAGQPVEAGFLYVLVEVYPRTRGATPQEQGGYDGEAGLSPHARGNLLSVGGGGTGPRSIPARAGQPPLRWLPGTGMEVYPRTRGATIAGIPANPSSQGLSPHARGNPVTFPRGIPPFRSIPARAGQPEWYRVDLAMGKVYPRTRGATTRWPGLSAVADGLSPHARGNPAPRAWPWI